MISFPNTGSIDFRKCFVMAKRRARKRTNPGAKGSRHERAVCQQLSMWATDAASMDIFWRSSTSGARATRRGRTQGQKIRFQAGDICAVDPLGQWLLLLFTLECKFYKDAGYSLLVNGLPRVFAQLWSQSKSACVNTEPLLIVKENRRDVVVFTTKAGYLILKKCAPRGLSRTVIFPGIDAHGFLFRDFLVRVKYPEIIALAKKKKRDHNENPPRLGPAPNRQTAG